MSPEQWTLGALVLAIAGAGVSGAWVFGWVYRAMERDRDFWRARALAALGLAAVATEEAEKPK